MRLYCGCGGGERYKHWSRSVAEPCRMVREQYINICIHFGSLAYVNIEGLYVMYSCCDHFDMTSCISFEALNCPTSTLPRVCRCHI